MEEASTLWTKWTPVRLVRLQQIASGVVTFDDGKVKVFEPKIKELLYLLQEELKNEKIVVCFARNAEILAVARVLHRAGIRTGSITGATPINERKEKLSRFNTAGIRVLLCQTKCVRFGLDLSASDTIVFFSNGYSQEDRMQCEERIENITKARTLLVVDLLAQGTVDEAILKALLDKKAASRQYFFKSMVKEAFNG